MQRKNILETLYLNKVIHNMRKDTDIWKMIASSRTFKLTYAQTYSYKHNTMAL